MKALIVILALLGSTALAQNETDTGPQSTLEEDFDFMGCRPSPVECKYSFSCNPLRVIYDPQLCEDKFEHPMDAFACYCGKSID
jgi:hypothetical protein